MTSTLYYVTDPMCSWCWGFHPQLEQIRAALPADVPLRYVLGGLAPDSDEPMDEATRGYVQAAWRDVEARAGARFNHEFWTRCSPRRSTYSACRAVLAAAVQDEDGEEGSVAGPRARLMFEAIQRAYYLQARNPSDTSLLEELAGEIESLDADRFAQDLKSAQTEARLQQGFELRKRLDVRGFPSLVLLRDEHRHVILQGYATAAEVLATLERSML
jgi:putative protein-disulfide isomerase